MVLIYSLYENTLLLPPSLQRGGGEGRYGEGEVKIKHSASNTYMHPNNLKKGEKSKCRMLYCQF